MTSIKFYDPKDPFYEFSNFFVAPFELDGRTWQTAEHYYQAAKFPDFPEYVDAIRSCNTPSKCFILANQKCKGGYSAKWMINPAAGDRRLLNDVIREYIAKGVRIRPDWNIVKVEVMKKCLTTKFTQNDALRTLLISTGDTRIIENSPRDSFWGIGKNGDGTNWLGLLLMELREELVEQEIQ